MASLLNLFQSTENPSPITVNIHKKRLAEQCKRFGFYQPLFFWITWNHITMHGFILAAFSLHAMNRPQSLFQWTFTAGTIEMNGHINGKHKNAICHRMSTIKMNSRLLKLHFRSVCSSVLNDFSSQFVYICWKSNKLLLVYYSYKMRSANYL